MIDPGKLLLNNYGEVKSDSDVLASAKFMLIESKKDAILPIDLDCNIDRFQTSTLIYSPINGKQVLSIIEYL